MLNILIGYAIVALVVGSALGVVYVVKRLTSVDTVDACVISVFVMVSIALLTILAGLIGNEITRNW